jgi:hypothetical protein
MVRGTGCSGWNSSTLGGGGAMAAVTACASPAATAVLGGDAAGGGRNADTLAEKTACPRSPGLSAWREPPPRAGDSPCPTPGSTCAGVRLVPPDTGMTPRPVIVVAGGSCLPKSDRMTPARSACFPSAASTVVPPTSRGTASRRNAAACDEVDDSSPTRAGADTPRAPESPAACPAALHTRASAAARSAACCSSAELTLDWPRTGAGVAPAPKLACASPSPLEGAVGGREGAAEGSADTRSNVDGADPAPPRGAPPDGTAAAGPTAANPASRAATPTMPAA